MTQINYIQFHIGDFLGGVIGFDAAETGAYMMLLCAHYQAGAQGLPDDDEYLARVAKVGMKSWRKIRSRLESKFTIENGFWVSDRVAKELLRVNEVSARNSAKALKRHAPEHAAAEPRQCKPITNNQEPEVRVKDIPSEYPKKSKTRVAEKPVDVSAEVWADYKTLRNAKRAPVTETVIAQNRREAEKAGWTLESALSECCARGWQGFKAEWINQTGKGNFSGSNQPRLTKSDRIAAALDAAQEQIFAGLDGGEAENLAIAPPAQPKLSGF